jgi:hypothetical protein
MVGLVLFAAPAVVAMALAVLLRSRWLPLLLATGLVLAVATFVAAYLSAPTTDSCYEVQRGLGSLVESRARRVPARALRPLLDARSSDRISDARKEEVVIARVLWWALIIAGAMAGIFAFLFIVTSCLAAGSSR